MSGHDWKPLFYTCDCYGDYMRWDGKIFPNRENLVEPHNTFDVQLKNGAVYPGYFVHSRGDDAAFARAITQDDQIIELQHGDLLRPAVVDKETKKKMRKVASDLCRAENRAKIVQQLESRKTKLSAELAQIDAELAKLKKEETK